MKIKALTMVALAAIAAGALSLSEPVAAAGGAKTKFERTKTHDNAGSLGDAVEQPDPKLKQPEPQPEPPVEKPNKKQAPTQP